MPDNKIGDTATITPHTNGEDVNEVQESTQQFVTVEQFQAVKKALDSLQAAQRRANTTPAAVPTVKASEPEPNTVKAQLEAIQAEIRADKEALAKERRESAISTAIASHGLDADNAEILEALIEKKFGQNIKVEGKTVNYLDDLTGDKVSIKDLVANIVKEKGDRFKPAVQTPNKSIRPNSVNKQSNSLPSSRDERLKMSTEQWATLFKQAQNK